MQIDAVTMLDECVHEGQAARLIPDHADAAKIRVKLRQLARQRRIKIRTARVADTVVVARVDASLWHDDTATMRAKLTPT